MNATTTIHSFTNDLAVENREASALFWTIAYNRLFGGIRGQAIAPKGSAEQKAGIDRWVTLASGETVSVQEKTRKRQVRDLLLELRHVAADGRTWAGWANQDGKADFLLYVSKTDGECRLWRTADLQRVLRRNYFGWQKRFPIRCSRNRGYETEFICVPLSLLPEPQTCQVNPRLFRVRDTTGWAAGRSDYL